MFVVVIQVIPQLKGEIDEHAQLLMAHVQPHQAGLVVIALLALHQNPIHIIRRPPNLLTEPVFLMAREVVEVNIHQHDHFAALVHDGCMWV